MDKLELFNRLARHIRPAFAEYKDVTSLDAELKDTGLDSLDFVMMGIYLSTIYGVPEHISKDFAPTTVGEFFDLNEQHKTQEPPATVDDCMEMVK
jgi:acyl carrier protein